MILKNLLNRFRRRAPLPTPIPPRPAPRLLQRRVAASTPARLVESNSPPSFPDPLTTILMMELYREFPQLRPSSCIHEHHEPTMPDNDAWSGGCGSSGGAGASASWDDSSSSSSSSYSSDSYSSNSGDSSSSSYDSGSSSSDSCSSGSDW